MQFWNGFPLAVHAYENTLGKIQHGHQHYYYQLDDDYGDDDVFIIALTHDEAMMMHASAAMLTCPMYPLMYPPIDTA